ncbi:MAG: hypothetical protein H0T79_06225 [Deltaproteobacteria bacterium]|nr:hypothetical protein [Deltaproteobacteria bacterium]
MMTGCVAEVAVYEAPEDSDLPPEGSEAALTNNQRTAFNYFVSKGLTKVQSAGIVGNMMQESSVSPTAVEFGGGPGRGIAQWSVGGRWDTDRAGNVKAFAAARGVSRWAMTTQLDFVWHELTVVGGYGLSEIRAATTLATAVYAFQSKFERCGTCAQAKRITYAQQVLSAYGGGGGSTDTGAGGAADECYSSTLGRNVAENTCVQSAADSAWYQCSDGEWVDRYSNPEACVSEHPL